MKPTARLVLLASLLLLLAPLHPSSGFPGHREGENLIGVSAPPLGLQRWLNSPPLEMKALQGKVALIRWWTDECPFCSTTAPALRKLHRKYGNRGLQVIGIFHPKPPGDWSIERVRQSSERFGFTFPVALDGDWQALRRWWLDREPRAWTSVSFLIDKKGIIRYVHPGGEFHEGPGGGRQPNHENCLREYKEIEQAIGRLLAE